MHTVVLSSASASFPDGDTYPLRKLFSDGELFLDLSSLDFSSRSFLLVQSFFGCPSNILELLFAIDVISRNTSTPVHILVPYLSYSRQDREISPHHPMSSKIIANILSSQNISTISVVDLHSPQIQCFFQKPCFNISLKSFFLEHIRTNFNIKDIVVCAADIGAAKNARNISEELGVESAIVEKIRSAPGISRAVSVVGDIKNKTCIIVDDIIDSAGTLCNAADILKTHGAKSIVAYATHGIFSGNAVEKIQNSALEQVFVSSTIPSPKANKITNINVSSFVLDSVKERLANFKN